VLTYNSESFGIARRECSIYGAIVAICGFIFAIGVALVIQRFFHFEFHDNSGIVGWISANKYPKQQEMFYFLSALIFVPSFSVLCFLFWLVYSKAISRLIPIPVRRILKQDALTYFSLLFIIGKLNQLELPPGKLFFTPIGLFLSAKIIFLFFNVIRMAMTKAPSSYDETSTLPHADNGISKEPGDSLSVSALHHETSVNQDARLNWKAIWSILASGLCIFFYVLLGYIHKSPTLLFLFIILSATTLGPLGLSLFYSFIVSRKLRLQFHNVLAYEAYALIPAALLLLFAVFHPSGKYLLLIVFFLSFFGAKLLFLISTTCRQFVDKTQEEGLFKEFRQCTHLFQQLTTYLTIPALIYVFFYGGGNINQVFEFFYNYDGIDLFHEGEKLAPLNELLRGGIPFRDIYIQHGLFQNAFRPLLASALFGDTLAAVRLLERLFVPMGYVTFYILGVQVFKSRLTAILAVFVASSQNLWVSDRHSLGLISIAFTANYITRYRDLPSFSAWQGKSTCAGRWFEFPGYCLPYGWNLIFGGICATLAFFFSTEVGLYAFAICFLFLLTFGFIRKGVSLKFGALNVLYYCAGAFLCFLPFAAYFGWYSALDDLIVNSYIQCAYQIHIWGKSFPGLLGTLSGMDSLNDIYSFVLSETFRWYLPVLIFLITATYLLYRAVQGRFWSSESNAKLLLLFLAGIIFFRTTLGRADDQRLIYGAIFMWLISLFFLERIMLRSWRNLFPPEATHPPVFETTSRMSFRIPQAILASIPILLFIWYVSIVHIPVKRAKLRLYELTRYGSIQRDVRETLQRAGGIQLPDGQVSQIREVVKYIQSNTSPSEPIFDFSNQGAYYFFADRPAATRYHQIVYASTTSAQKEVIHNLETTKTRFVIFKTGSLFDTMDGVPTVDRLPIITRYLEKNYQEDININGTVILVRKDRRNQ
jgi:hypothetical protein